MTEQEGTHASTTQRRSRKISTINQQTDKPTPALQRPAHDDPEAWKAYWKERGQPWRTEPEIDAVRQAFWTERRSIPPDIKQGIYPLKDLKLSRADVEWLLATHEHGGLALPRRKICGEWIVQAEKPRKNNEGDMWAEALCTFSRSQAQGKSASRGYRALVCEARFVLSPS